MKLGPRVRSAAYLATLVSLLVVFAVLLFVFTRRVDGVSMRPTLEAGDMVVLQFGNIGDVKVGDIIVFNDPTFGGCEDFTIIHRVVGVGSDGGLITQGDNRATNPVPDEPSGGPYVHQQCLVGKVVFVIPYLERLADLLPYPTNYVLAALIILFVIFSEMTGGGKKEPSTKGGETAA
jgi:signal peptidase I